MYMVQNYAQKKTGGKMCQRKALSLNRFILPLCVFL